MKSRKQLRDKRRKRIRAVIAGTVSVPRLAIYRSLRFFVAQAIDDDHGATMVSDRVEGNTIAVGKTLGVRLTKLLLAKKIKRIVFDRGGNRYHGAVKAIADALREGGIVL